jgi:hypothetical protein
VLNADCTSGNECVSGACTPKQDVCHYSSDCPTGDVCADGRCVTGCGDDAGACGTGFTCTKGACEPNPTGSTCSSASDCSTPTPVCAGGFCTAACDPNASPGTCPTGQYCNQGACVPDTRPQSNCTSDPECTASGGAQKCLDGICKYTCSNANDAGNYQCETIDTRIGYCASDGVCRSASEANPQCTSQGDCQSGKDCISNVCQ